MDTSLSSLWRHGERQNIVDPYMSNTCITRSSADADKPARRL